MEPRGRGKSQSRNQPPPQQSPQQRAQSEGETRMAKRQQETTDVGFATVQQTAPFFSLVENKKVNDMIQDLAKTTLLKPDRLIYIARAGLSRSPQLLKCTPLSWVGALMDCAQLGLEPVTALGQFYFVPYWNNQTKTLEVQGQIGYIGITELARRSGEIGPVRMEAVFEGDYFKVCEGAGILPDGNRVASYFVHEPDFAKRTNRIIAAWCKVIWKDPAMEIFKVIDSAEIAKHRAMSQSATGKNPQFSPWTKWEPQMSAKTAVRAIRPSLPQSATKPDEPTTLARALAVDEAIDLGLDSGSRWRDLGDHGEKIDGLLEDVGKHPTRGEQVQVPAQLEKPKGDDGPPPADEPPGDMADRVEQSKAKPKPEEPTVAPSEPTRTAQEIVAAFKGNYRITQEDLEKAAAADGEPPLQLEDWDDQCLVFFEGVLEQVRGAADEGAMRTVLYRNLRLEPGSLG